MFKKIKEKIKCFFKAKSAKQNDETRKYIEERDRIKNSISSGKIDNSGNTVTKVFVTGDEYAVYEIKTDILSESLRTSIFPFTKEDTNEIEKKFDGIRIKYSQIKGQLYKASDDTSIKTQVAHIVSHALSGHVDEANNSFDLLLTSINTEYKAQLSHRVIYLITALFIVLALICVCIIVYRNNYFSTQVQIKNMLFVTTAACIGGFTSVSRKIRDAVFEKDASNWVFFLYAIERMFISAVAGFVAYAAIKCKLIFGIVAELESPIWGFILFAVVAGFSETLIPGLLSKLEQDNKG